MENNDPIIYSFSYYDCKGNIHEAKGLIEKKRIVDEIVKDLIDYYEDNITFTQLLKKWEDK